MEWNYVRAWRVFEKWLNTYSFAGLRWEPEPCAPSASIYHRTPSQPKKTWTKPEITYWPPHHVASSQEVAFHCVSFGPHRGLRRRERGLCEESACLAIRGEQRLWTARPHLDRDSFCLTETLTWLPLEQTSSLARGSCQCLPHMFGITCMSSRHLSCRSVAYQWRLQVDFILHGFSFFYVISIWFWMESKAFFYF